LRPFEVGAVKMANLALSLSSCRVPAPSFSEEARANEERMFKVRDDSKIYEWRAKLEAQRRKFASLEEMQGQNGGARHLCIPSSGQFSGAYAEEGYKGDTTYALSFEPGRGCSVKISGSVSDNDGQARIQVCVPTLRGFMCARVLQASPGHFFSAAL
jgi:hypothetical protein